MDLADLTLVPSSFVETTIRAFYPHKLLARASYGVDLDFWRADDQHRERDHYASFTLGSFRYVRVFPLLLEAWEKAALREAELELVGSWQLAEASVHRCPWRGVAAALLLRSASRSVSRSRCFRVSFFFEGLRIGVARGYGLRDCRQLASEATAGPDVMTETCGRVVPTGNLEAWLKAYGGSTRTVISYRP